MMALSSKIKYVGMVDPHLAECSSWSFIHIEIVHVLLGHTSKYLKQRQVPLHCAMREVGFLFSIHTIF